MEGDVRFVGTCFVLPARTIDTREQALALSRLLRPVGTTAETKELAYKNKKGGPNAAFLNLKFCTKVSRLE
jgi:hypothetical protein